MTGPGLQNVGEHALQFQRPLISPLLPEQESTFNLEQQWQDVLAIMESQVCKCMLLTVKSQIISSSVLQLTYVMRSIILSRNDKQKTLLML